MRSKLLLSLFGKTTFSFVVTEMLSKVLKQTPSLHETMSCSRDTCKYEAETLRPYLTMNMNVFANHMENIEKSVSANLNFLVKCTVCGSSVCMRRKFGHHLFIEVSEMKILKVVRLERTNACIS